MPTRRQALTTGLITLAIGRLQADEPTASLDRLMTTFVRDNRVPGAALAVAKDGRVVYAQGFGSANRESNTPVKADSRFRIASVSKPLTAAAVLKLVELGKLRLDDPAHTHLPKFVPPPGNRPDPRWKSVTVRHLLQHTAGWDRSKSGDPIGQPRAVAKALGTNPPVPPRGVARYALGRPLDHDPGTKYAYSNVGYLLLGRIIEHLSRRPYERFVQDAVLAPLGVTGPRLGRARVADRPLGEVRYYDRRSRVVDSLYTPGQQVPLCDGGENFKGYEAHGGWVASAPELARFAGRFVPTAEVTARPVGVPGEGAVYYGAGWQVRSAGGGFNLWHTGYIAGTEALLVRRHDGFSWAVLFNTQDTPTGRRLAATIDGPIHPAVDAVQMWQGED